MPDPVHVRDLAERLSSSDAATRQMAAAELYARGRALGDAAVERWRADPGFAALLAGAPTVGIAVQPEQFEKIRAANGSPRLASAPPDQDAREFELQFRHVCLDILTTSQPGGGGALARFLEKFGEGIQQVEYPVSDVEAAMEILHTRFHQEPIYPRARPGAEGTRVNFFLAAGPASGKRKEGKKVLIELVEAPK